MHEVLRKSSDIAEMFFENFGRLLNLKNIYL